MLCHYCGVLGNDLRHCASYFAASKQGAEVELQYGDRLKATGGRSQSPLKRNAEQDRTQARRKEKIDRMFTEAGRRVNPGRWRWR